MAKTPKGRDGKGDRKARLAEVRRIVSENGLTIEDVFPDDTQPAANPCENESAGFLICNGSSQEVVAFPSGGPWVPQVTNGVITFANAAGASAVESAPPPRENGPGEQTLM
jgi:hypothetical protein